jgi:hypothetical protein
MIHDLLIDYVVADHSVTTDFLTLPELVSRIQDWGGLWVADVHWSPGSPTDYYQVDVMWTPDLGEYVRLHLSGETPREVWLAFIARAPVETAGAYV